MSRKTKKEKKSTSKYRKFKISPLIPVIAIIEVLVLIGVSTFAWFSYSANKQLNSGIISVDTDSGLDIDFQYADAEHDYINIWDYVDKNFEFEPVTSLDGRNVFVPTSGTYEKTNTEQMVFREGTVNDINSKYINIDFELTNTSDYLMDIYLNNNSFFRVKDSNDKVEESRALRLAFYTNDGNFGNVGSSLISRADYASDGGGTTTVADNDPNAFTIYFDNSDTKWDNIYAHFWEDHPNDADDVPYKTWPGVQMTRFSGSTYVCTIKNPSTGGSNVRFDKVIFSNNGNNPTDAISLTQASKNNVFKKNANDNGCTSTLLNDSSFTIYFDNTDTQWSTVYAHFWDDDSNDANDVPYKTWPGVQMSRVSGSAYMCTIKNPPEGETGVTFDKVKFSNNGSSATNAVSLTQASNNKLFKKNANNNCTASDYTTNTVYFLKPKSWNNDYDGDGIADLYCTAYFGNYGYTPGTGDKMDYVGGGIYSYTYNSGMTGGVLFNNLQSWNNNSLQTQDIRISDFGGTLDNKIFYCDGTTTSNKLNAKLLKRDASNYYHFNTESDNDVNKLGYHTIYFYNSHDWSTPYLYAEKTGDTFNGIDIPMTSLSGNVYYCSVPEWFDTIYFHQKGSNASTGRTVSVTPQNGYVYRPADQTSGVSGYWNLTTPLLYSDYTQESGYPVISPGVSVGFQRPYSPVVEINSSTGKATEVIPAFANSIDDYIYSGTGKEIFTIEPHCMVSLSMVLWLEGTDLATFDTTYPGNNIELRLEFATVTHRPIAGTDREELVVNNRGDNENYTFLFYDKTRELWTSNRVTSESGATVSPVMQLYDCTIGRGYLMQPYSYGSYGGKKKVDCWAVDAPPSIATLGHDLEFRRVNPYDESEVWNYWHPGRVAGGESDRVYRNKSDLPIGSSGYAVYDVAKQTVGDDVIISFSAFADGSPLESVLQSNSTANGYNYTAGSAGVPAYSCGGLWGNHNVQTMTVVDGTLDQWIKNTDVSNTQGILNMSYSYTYSGSGSGNSRTVNIEYKSSVGYNTMYYFVVPEMIYQLDSNDDAIVDDIKFKRYYNFKSSYAINSDRNDKLKYHKTFDAGIATGEYYEIGETVTNADNKERGDRDYWGSDILYVQTWAAARRWMHTDLDAYRMLEIEFYNNSTDQHFYQTLFDNYNFKGSEADSYGYPVVIPNDNVYYNYNVKYKHSNGTDVKFRSDEYDLSNDTDSNGTIPRVNTAFDINNGVSGNIMIIDYFYPYHIYIQTDVNDFNRSYDNVNHVDCRYLYQWRSQWNDVPFTNYNVNYPGSNSSSISSFSSNGKNYTKYKFTINGDATGVKANNGSNGFDNVKIDSGDISLSPENRFDIFEWTRSGSTNTVRVVGNQPDGGDYQKAFHSYTTSADSTDWPHYSAN